MKLPPPSSGGGGGGSAVVIAAVVVVLTLAGGFALSYYVIPPRIAEEIAKRYPPDSSDDATAPATPAKEGAAPAKEGGKEGEGAKGGGESKDFTINDLLVNVADSGATRFVKTTVFFEADPAVLSDLESKRAKIQDIVAQTIGSKKMAELTAPDARGKLREELLATINPLLDAKGEVKNIYFPEFIIQ